MKLHFKSYGGGEPLIVLHGLFGSLENWQPMSLKLAEFFHVFALDQRNHGASPHSMHMDYPTMAVDLEEFMGAQGLARASVIGHSMGGKTTMQFALSFPQRVEKLIVVDMAPREYLPRHEKLLEALLVVDLGAHRTRSEIELALAPGIPDLGLRRFLLKGLDRDAIGGFHWRIGLREIQKNLVHLREPVAGEAPNRGPTLFVRGASSDYLLEEDLVSIKSLFPNAQLRTVPDAGHLVHYENPDGFLQAVLPFLRQGTAPGPCL